ncbi:galactokinase [Chryseolinea sp. T2]|uniref:galactokinase n=1 Tax=Chryseolinea sp. T2 TaxID=3129255 RepID=UPI0030775FC8
MSHSRERMAMHPLATKVREAYIRLHGSEPLLVRSPGRINLIGEHTDYNDGFVMPAGIDREMVFAIGRSKDKTSSLHALKHGQTYEFDIQNPVRVAHPVWANYMLGVLHQYKEKGLKMDALHCVVDGDVPTGAGLSSSAALECGFAFGVDHLHQFKLPRLEMVHTAQWSEHQYVGVMCGIMDQFASMMSMADKAFMLDCRSLEYHYFPLDLKDYTLVLCDTMVKHSLASSGYNTRRQECEEGVRILQSYYSDVKSLRDATLSQIEQHRSELGDVVYRRCRYVVEENARVHEAANHLAKGDLIAFGQRMYESHRGLSQMYEVSCDELDYMFELAQKHPDVIGARMMGGGFGGCTINLVQRSGIDDFISTLQASYRRKFGVDMGHYIVKLVNGTSVIDN